MATKYSELIDLFAAGPEMLRNATRGMSREQLIARPVPDKWSTLEVVCHLADFEIVYADRIKRTIVEEQPLLADGDESLYAARLSYHSRELDEELHVIGALTAQVVRILRTLQEADFQRIGRHSAAGPLTLAQFVERKAQHFPHHIRFIEEKRAALGL